MIHQFCYHYSSSLCLKPDVIDLLSFFPFPFYLIGRKLYRLKRAIVVSRKQLKALQAYHMSIGVK